MKSTEIRNLWSQFRERQAPPERKHARAKPASLIVNQADDPTTMFNTAGMQQFVPYLMGKKHPQGQRLYNIQGCVRTTDIEEVGDVSHLTFFEMMGNWSLGEYFKHESIQRSWAFLTGKEWLGIDPAYLAVSVFAGDDDAPRDEESADIWKSVGVSSERIAYLPKSENWWGPAGATGPCGPDTEIFYRIGEGSPPTRFDPEGDEDDRLEIRNNVFMAYYKDDQGNYLILEQKNVDTGMGFERLCLVMQCLSGQIETSIKDASVYETDLFVPIMQRLGSLTDDVRRQRIMADHLRTSFWLIQEGLVPSNEGRGYVLRRLIRRMYFQRYRSIDQSVRDRADFVQTKKLLQQVMSDLNQIYQDKFQDGTVKVLLAEIKQFARTIHHGEQILSEMLTQLNTNQLPGRNVFKLYDTYGFPVELTQELAAEHHIEVDMSGFHQELERAQQQSRQASQQMFSKEIDRATHIDGLQPTRFLGYDQLEVENVSLIKDFEVEGQRVMVFDQTPMYAEGGGQTGDRGRVELDTGELLEIKDVHKYGGVWLHFVR